MVNKPLKGLISGVGTLGGGGRLISHETCKELAWSFSSWACCQSAKSHGGYQVDLTEIWMPQDGCCEVKNSSYPNRSEIPTLEVQDH